PKDGGGEGGQNIGLADYLDSGTSWNSFVAVVMTVISAKFVEHRLGKWDPADHGEGWDMDEEHAPDVSPEAEAKGLRWALWGTVAVLAAITLLTAIPGAPLRNPETGKIIGDSPFMDSLIVIIMIVFYVGGYLYGRGAGTIKGHLDVIETITKSWAGLASLLFLFLLIAQFIAYFNFSGIAEVLAVKLGDVLEDMNIGAVWLLIGLIILA